MEVLQAVKAPMALPRHWRTVELSRGRPPAAQWQALPLPAALA
jgi:hypothetical protein